MKFDTPATTNPIDQLKVIGRAPDRIDGPLKTTGTAPYAYERHDAAPNAAYGYMIGAAIAKGKIVSIDLERAKAAHGVLAIGLSKVDPAGAVRVFPGGADYWIRQYTWITTGVDPEYKLSSWVPAHAILLAGSTLFSFTSLGALTFFTTSWIPSS